jgi:chromosome segregation ATPase
MPEDSEAPAGAAARANREEPPAGEADLLRARLKETTSRLERVRRERDDYRTRVEHLQAELQGLRQAPAPAAVASGKVLVDQESHEELRRAKRDLVRLLRRLGRPPLGWVLHRQKGYRRLRERWLREG